MARATLSLPCSDGGPAGLMVGRVGNRDAGHGAGLPARGKQPSELALAGTFPVELREGQETWECLTLQGAKSPSLCQAAKPDCCLDEQPGEQMGVQRSASGLSHQRDGWSIWVWLP